jgi:hypothetical protein
MQYRIRLDQNTTVQRQTYRIPTSFKENGKATKERRKTIMWAKIRKQVNGRSLVDSIPSVPKSVRVRQSSKNA